MTDISFSKLRLSPDLSRRVVRYKVGSETMTGAVMRAIRDGVEARLTNDVIELQALAAIRAVESGDSTAAVRYLRSIIGLVTMADNQSVSRSPHEAQDDLPGQADA